MSRHELSKGYVENVKSRRPIPNPLTDLKIVGWGAKEIAVIAYTLPKLNQRNVDHLEATHEPE